MTEKEPAKVADIVPAEDAPKPKATEAAKHTKADLRVRLRTVGPKDRFDLSSSGFGVVDYVGKDFTPDEADEVLMIALKNGVKLVAVDKED